MKASIDVKNRDEAAQIQTALADPTVRAFVLIMGALIPLPSDRARERVLRFVEDHAAERAELERAAPPQESAVEMLRRVRPEVTP